jgi:hypothetical protein
MGSMLNPIKMYNTQLNNKHNLFNKHTHIKKKKKKSQTLELVIKEFLMDTITPLFVLL